MKTMQAREVHRGDRVGWLRAAVLGANDGVLSTASLIVGVAAANVAPRNIFVAGIAGLVAGAMAMAAGEYVSVSSQADTEKADVDLERKELAKDLAGEKAELAAIYVRRGLTASLADEVAEQLMAHDALGAHSRDELGFSEALKARPIQAALASAVTFAVGATVPLVIAIITPANLIIPLVFGSSLLFLGVLGGLAARVGGAPPVAGAIRVILWGALAMAFTAAVGALFGTAI